jgi:hypothetical protein
MVEIMQKPEQWILVALEMLPEAATHNIALRFV